MMDKTNGEQRSPLRKRVDRTNRISQDYASVITGRGVAAQFERPVLLRLGGKEVIVVTHLPRQAW